jgi:hypothetical protein
MTQDEKKLLLRDLCARLPYGVMIYLHTSTEFTGSVIVLNSSIYGFIEDVLNNSPYEIKEIKPYLRQMSSMTKEEEAEYDATFATIKYDNGHLDSAMTYKSFDYLNANHFDYRGLIPMGLALEATKDMYES